MRKYIEFEIAKKYLHEACAFIGSNGGLMLKIKFDQEPKADVVEVVHGEWTHVKGRWNDYLQCSVCHKNTVDTTAYQKMNYCPNCGARMNERREDG